MTIISTVPNCCRFVLLSGFAMAAIVWVSGCGQAAPAGGGGDVTECDPENGGDCVEPDTVTLTAPEVETGDTTPTYMWQQQRGIGPDVELREPTSRTPSFFKPDVDEETVLNFTVTITVNGVAEDFDIEVTITPSSDGENDEDGDSDNRGPVVEPGGFQRVTVGQTVTLNARGSSDPDGDELTFQWVQYESGSKQAPAEVTITDSNMDVARFVPSVAGTYLFAVKVSDGLISVLGITSVVAEEAPMECTTDAQCAEGETCKNGVCESPPDLCAGIICEEGETCDPATGLCESTPTPGRLIESHFDTDDEGWRVIGNVEQEQIPTFSADNGRPGGHVFVTTQSSGWFFNAPSAFLGDVSDAMGYFLYFDLFQSSRTVLQNREDDVVLVGGGVELQFDVPYNPLFGWTHYQVPLDPTAAGWLNPATATAPTEQEMLTVLTNLGQLTIRGHHLDRNGANVGLDNVVLELGRSRWTTVTENPASTFDQDTDGWLVAGNSPTGRGAEVPIYRDILGRPGGHVYTTTIAPNAWHWNAPDKFLGDCSQAYGRTLKFDLYESSLTVVQSHDDDVVLIGGGLMLVYDLPEAPQKGWSAYSVNLDETDTRWLSLTTNVRPTTAEFQTVLSSLGQILIRGHYLDRDDAEVGLDNVRLDVGSEPNPAKEETVTSTFDAGDDGWIVLANSPTGRGAEAPNLTTAGGRPSGHLTTEIVNTDGMFWDAPAAFLGDVSAAIGRSLRFDLYQASTSVQQSRDRDVVLRGAGMILQFDLANPGRSWHSYEVLFDPAEMGWLNVETQIAPTSAEMIAVLSDLDQLSIRGYFLDRAGHKVGLDHVALDLGSTPAPIRVAPVVSTFDVDDDGWLVTGNSTTGAGSDVPFFDDGGLDADGFISATTNVTNSWYWDAPEKFLGNVSGAVGHTLSFELFQSSTSVQQDRSDDVIIRGDGLELQFDFGEGNNPGTGWTFYAVPFDPTDTRWLNTATQVRPTADEMQRVLSSLRQLLIRGHFLDRDDATVGLDNVTLDIE